MMTIETIKFLCRGDIMLAIDHLVIVSKNPEKDAKNFSEKNEVTVVEGGKHESWGTYNYLAFFKNDCYIEWLGIFDESLARQSDNPLIQQTVRFLDRGKTGLMTYALRTNELDKYLTHYQENEIAYKGPFPGSRKKIDGSVIAWRMLFPEKETLPFFIEWESGINLPNDKKNINSKTIDTIKSPYDPSYETVFKFKPKDKEIELINGKLLFTNEKLPSFILK